MHEINEMGADISQTLTLLVYIKEPCRPEVRDARYCLKEVMHALHVYGRLSLSSHANRAKRTGVVDEFALQD